MMSNLITSRVLIGVSFGFGLLSCSALADWQWSTPEDLGTHTGSPFPQVSLDPKSGSAMAVWIDETNVFSPDIRAARLFDRSWTASTVINDTATPAMRGQTPQVIQTNKISGIAAWLSYLPTTNAILISSSAYKKQNNTVQWRVANNEISKNNMPVDFQVVQSNSQVRTAYWIESISDTSNAIRSSRYKNNKWQAATTIAQGPGLWTLKVTGKNNLTIASWSEKTSTGFVIKSSQLKSGKWSTPINVSVAGDYIDASPDLTIDGKNNVISVWERYNPANKEREILSSKMSKGVWSPPVRIGSGGNEGSSHPRLSSSKKGYIAAVWWQQNPASSSLDGLIKASHSNDGMSWNEEMTIGGTGMWHTKPQLTMDSMGNATAAWEASIGTTYGIQTSHRSNGGLWDEAIDLCKECGQPSMSSDDKGNVIAVWAAGSGLIQSSRGYEQVQPSACKVEPNARCAGVDWTGKNLEKANLQLAILTDAKMDKAILTDATLRNATLNRASLINAIAEKTDFSEASLVQANLDSIQMHDATLRSANLESANLSNSKIGLVTFNSAVLTNTKLQGADATSARFSNVVAKNADMRKSVMNEAIFNNSDMTGVNLSESSLINAKFIRTNLTDANLDKAILTGSSFAGATLCRTRMPDGSINNANCPKQ